MIDIHEHLKLLQEPEILNFEEPMALLVHLIEKNNSSIYDIPISEITDQYINYIKLLKKEKSMDSMSRFILLASTLLEIKSRMLLPKQADEETNDIDPREELVNRLIEYKRFKAVTEHLYNLSDCGRFFYREYDEIVYKYRDTEIDYDILFGDIDLIKLYDIFNDVMARRELKTDKVRKNFNSVEKDIYTIEEKMDFIRDRIFKHNQIKFKNIFDKDTTKQEVIVTFLAMLELIKIKFIDVIQDKTFSEIYLTKTKEHLA